MPRAKRQRSVEPRDARLEDPYLLQRTPCRAADHHRKKSALRNCADNPNCLFGLGERQRGVWKPNALIRRAFGDDPRERQRATTKTHRLMPCGLRNLGATCYLNSMLQCLFVNLPLRRAVFEWEPKPQVDAEQTSQMRALQKLFAQMQLGSESFYDPAEFASTLALNNVMQQDAQEFSKLLLAHLRTIFTHSRHSRHWDLVDQLFQGQMSYVTKCLHCKNKSSRPSSYYEISLIIKGHKSVENSIESYLSAELLDGENKYFCEHCNAKQCAERFLELKPKALPPTLMVQLMRFVYDANAGRKKKLTDIIEINETLNMTELLRRSGHAEAFEETNDAVYRLQGYLNHRGKSAHVGHYTAAVAHPSDTEGDVEWFEFDDAVVSDATTSEAAKERSHGKKIRSRDIYMLFYVRDDSASGSSSDVAGVKEDVPQPSKEYLDKVLALNASFQADVLEYTERVSGLENRINKRVYAYKRFFEKTQPYVSSSSNDFYWVDTEWLRCWITGEEEDSSRRTSSVSSLPDEESKSVGKEESKHNITDLVSGDDHTDDECIIVDPLASNTAAKKEHGGDKGSTTESDPNGGFTETSGNDDNEDMEIVDESPQSNSGHTSPPDGETQLNADDIPFSKPVDVTPFCCDHSTFPTTESLQNSFTLCFAPESAPRLKRISAKFYQYLHDNCGLEAASDGLASGARRASMMAFKAPTYRCRVCEEAFHDKLVNNVDRLHEVDQELELLKGSPASVAAAVASGSSFLMSRAWISSYKTHLQQLHRELSQVASSSKKARKTSTSQKETSPKGSSSLGNAAAALNLEPELWQTPINDDITCAHGNISMEKRKYRPVSAETWSYFSAKFPYRAEFPEASTEICAQCRADDFVTKECIQVEREVRDEVLSVPALERLYRRKASSDPVSLCDLFELPPAEHGRGLEKASSWTKQDAARLPRRMFLVSHRWIAQWREYIRNVEEDTPPVLSLSPLLCQHQKLVLPPGLIAAQQGHIVESSSLGVEFVSLDEMLALVERYGDPDVSFYYGLLTGADGSDQGAIVWRRCSLASLMYGNEKAVKSGKCPDTVVPLICQDASDDSVVCEECQATSDRRHQDELENFSNRVVNVQLLNDDQPVPTTETLTPEANTSGRRRSRRIRPGSASTWPVSANAVDTVYMLKNKIYAEIDALPIRQRLYYKGEVLEDSRTLKQCGIKAGDAVFMRLSEESVEELVLDEGQEREVGFADSVFLSHALGSSPPERRTNGAPDTSGDHAMAVALSGSQETSVWVCPSCTFVNDDTDATCEMCSTVKV